MIPKYRVTNVQKVPSFRLTGLARFDQMVLRADPPQEKCPRVCLTSMIVSPFRKYAFGLRDFAQRPRLDPGNEFRPSHYANEVYRIPCKTSASGKQAGRRLDLEGDL